jgi:hypothetical protein
MVDGMPVIGAAATAVLARFSDRRGKLLCAKRMDDMQFAVQNKILQRNVRTIGDVVAE